MKKTPFFTGHHLVTAADIRIQVIVTYNLNLSLQFVTINFEFSWPMLQCSLNFCINLFFGRVVFSNAFARQLLRKDNSKA